MLVHDFMGTDSDDVEQLSRIQKSFFFIKRKCPDPGVGPEQIAAFFSKEIDPSPQNLTAAAAPSNRFVRGHSPQTIRVSTVQIAMGLRVKAGNGDDSSPHSARQMETQGMGILGIATLLDGKLGSQNLLSKRKDLLDQHLRNLKHAQPTFFEARY